MNKRHYTQGDIHMNNHAKETIDMYTGEERGTGSSSVIRRMAVFVLTAVFAGAALAGPTAVAGKAVAKPVAKAVSHEVVEKAAREAAEKAAREVGEKVAREAAEKAARKAAAKAASRTVGERVAKTIAQPKVLLAAGAGTAAVVGSHNVSTGARNALENVGEGVRDVAEKHPEMFPEVLRECGRPFAAVAHAIGGVVLLVLAGFAFWFFHPMIRSARARMAARATTVANGTGMNERINRNIPRHDIIDGEFEIRDEAPGE